MYSNKNNHNQINLKITNNNVNNDDIKELINILENVEKSKHNRFNIEKYLYFRTILDNVMKNCKLDIKSNENKNEYILNLFM